MKSFNQPNSISKTLDETLTRCQFAHKFDWKRSRNFKTDSSSSFAKSKIPVATWFRARAHARAFRAWSDGISGYAIF